MCVHVHVHLCVRVHVHVHLCVRVRVCVNVANTVWDYVFYFNVTILK